MERPPIVSYGQRTSRGFTIVELLIVIVIIAILAGLVITTFTGIQKKARDSQRKTDIAMITKTLELYYLDNGTYPEADGSTVINDSWSTTADASWSYLLTQLQPYTKKLPKDPTSSPGTSVLSNTGSYNYAYFSSRAGTYCGAGIKQMYILVYRLESGSQQNTLDGDCTTSPLGPYSTASNYRVRK